LVAGLENRDLGVDGDPHQRPGQLESVFPRRVRPDRVDWPEIDDQQGL